ncbi:MAG: histidine kinase dimerization/phosphoacceptor domain -containing protein [Salibacteraceae bacterium]
MPSDTIGAEFSKTDLHRLIDSLVDNRKYSLAKATTPQLMGAFSLLKEQEESRAELVAQLAVYEELFKRGEIKAAIRLGNALLVQADSFSATDQYSLYYTLSSAYFNLGYYDKYLELLPRKHQASRGYSNSFKVDLEEYSDLALVYHRMKQYDKARLYNRKIIQLNAGEPSYAASHSSLYNNIALTFREEQQTDSARFYFHKALALARKGVFKKNNARFSKLYKAHFINVIESDIAYLDQRPENHPRIIQCLEKEAASAQQVSEANIYLSAWNKLGQLYFERQECTKALHYLHLGDEELNEKNPQGELYFNNLQLKAKIALLQGKQALGNQLFEKSQAIRDALEAQRSRGITEVAAILYEIDNKEKEIEEQQLRLVEKNDEIQQQRRTQLVFIAFISVLSLLLLVLYRFVRKLNKQKQIIEQQKTAANDSLKQKEMLLKEIHHRVKNNLQVVSGILNKQAQKSPDPEVKALMEEGKSRIKSMALIHQKLYQTEDFTQIDFASYVADLSRSIALMHQRPGATIELEQAIPKLFFHIDVAVPLGLIINELLTNAYKHAFPHLRPGKVKITIVQKEAHQFELTVADDGVGYPSDFEQVSQRSLGIGLVEGLAWQLRGKFTYRQKAGSVFTVAFTDQLKPT